MSCKYNVGDYVKARVTSSNYETIAYYSGEITHIEEDEKYGYICRIKNKDGVVHLVNEKWIEERVDSISEPKFKVGQMVYHVNNDSISRCEVIKVFKDKSIILSYIINYNNEEFSSNESRIFLTHKEAQDKLEEINQPKSRYEVGDVLFYNYASNDDGSPCIVVPIKITDKEYIDNEWIYVIEYFPNKCRRPACIKNDNYMRQSTKITEGSMIMFEVKPLEFANR